MQCGLSLCRVPFDQLIYTRRNGKVPLQVLGRPQFGLPFGQDFLVPIWVATLHIIASHMRVTLHAWAKRQGMVSLPTLEVGRAMVEVVRRAVAGIDRTG